MYLILCHTMYIIYTIYTMYDRYIYDYCDYVYDICNCIRLYYDFNFILI